MTLQSSINSSFGAIALKSTRLWNQHIRWGFRKLYCLSSRTSCHTLLPYSRITSWFRAFYSTVCFQSVTVILNYSFHPHSVVNILFPSAQFRGWRSKINLAKSYISNIFDEPISTRDSERMLDSNFLISRCQHTAWQVWLSNFHAYELLYSSSRGPKLWYPELSRINSLLHSRSLLVSISHAWHA